MFGHLQDSFSSFDTNSSSNGSDPTGSLAAVIVLRIGVGTASALSVFGTSLIIVSFVGFRELRTTARQLLFNLSIAELIIALSHLVGLVENAGVFEGSSNDSVVDPHWLCTSQAAFSVFGTEASILWTVSIAVYFFVTFVLGKLVAAKRIVPLLYVISWGIPLCLTIWLAASGLLGFEPGGDPAFCGILGTKNSNGTEIRIWYPIVVGYDMWNYLAFIVLPVLYVAIRCKLRKVKYKDTEGSMQTISKTADRKLIAVPLVYLVLRVWSAGVDIAVFFLPPSSSYNYRRSVISVILLFLVGVCDSLPGFVNSLLFCVFTRPVRQKLWQGLCNVLQCRRCAPSDSSIQYEPTTSYSRPLETERAKLIESGSVRASYNQEMLETVSLTGSVRLETEPTSKQCSVNKAHI